MYPKGRVEASRKAKHDRGISPCRVEATDIASWRYIVDALAWSLGFRTATGLPKMLSDLSVQNHLILPQRQE